MFNINAAPLDIEGFRTVKSVGIGTYQIFQETYHEETYKKLHPEVPRATSCGVWMVLDRAMLAGIDDLGIGALMGLYDWKFEVMGLLYHTIHLEDRFGVGPHTISFPGSSLPMAQSLRSVLRIRSRTKILSIWLLRYASPYHIRE